MKTSKSADCHWPLKVVMATDEDAQTVGIREQDSLCVRHVVKSRKVTSQCPLFLGTAMDKASVRGLDLMNTMMTTPHGFGFEALPQVGHTYNAYVHMFMCVLCDTDVLDYVLAYQFKHSLVHLLE